MNELELRRQLRALQVGREPERDLWPGISHRLEGPRRHPRHYWVLALAASLVLAVLLLPRDGEFAPAPGPQDIATVDDDRGLTRDADYLTLHYRAALAELAQSPLPLALRPAASELEEGARQLRDALEQHPHSLVLLGQLRRTYEQRLRLSQRAALG